MTQNIDNQKMHAVPDEVYIISVIEPSSLPWAKILIFVLTAFVLGAGLFIIGH